MRRPTQDVRCSIGLSAAGWTTQDRSGWAPCVSKTIDAPHDPIDLTHASWVTRAGA